MMRCLGYIALCAASVLAASSASLAQIPGRRTLALRSERGAIDWCTVSVPESVVLGTTVDVRIAYRDAPPGTRFIVSLEFWKADGTSVAEQAAGVKHPDVEGDGEVSVPVSVPLLPDAGAARVVLRVAGGERAGTCWSDRFPVRDPGSAYRKWRNSVSFNKSWIRIDTLPLHKMLTEGEKVDLAVDYFLHPDEQFERTTVLVELLGPRVPRAGAPEPVTFANTAHLYFSAHRAEIQPGRGTVRFTVTVPRSVWKTSLLFRVRFVDGKGEPWPWDARATARYARKGGFFELETDVPGNLFTYSEQTRFFLHLKETVEPGEKKTVRYRVYDTTGREVLSGQAQFTVEAKGQRVPLLLRLSGRGTFFLQVEVDGWEKRETTFCRIPDIARITGGRQTQFGMTVHRGNCLGRSAETVFRIARRLGMTACRSFTEWSGLEPAPGEFAWSQWDPLFDAGRRNGMQMVVCIYDPPAWALKRGEPVGYRMFDGDIEAFRQLVAEFTRRYRGKFWGWEWLNEITPGGTPDCVADYVGLVRAGVESARAVDPDVKSVLAGGLWPRSFRLDVLNAGAAALIDVLPIHYGNGSGILEARQDVASRGARPVRIWDNETSFEVIQWEKPGIEIVSEKRKSQWVLSQMVDELAAGAEKVFFFGGDGSPTGDFDYIFSDFSPTPAAATLAVLAAKLWNARPVGVITPASTQGLFHLFERDGTAVLVASRSVATGEEVSLYVGSRSVIVTDYQGNQRSVRTEKGVLTLHLEPLACFIEGADIDVLKANLVASVSVPVAGGKREPLGAAPHLCVPAGRPSEARLLLQNPYQRPISGTVKFDLPAGWVSSPAIDFSLPAGEERIVPVLLTAPDSASGMSEECGMTVSFRQSRLPAVKKPFRVSVVSPAYAGNLLTNGGFEESDGKTDGWSGSGAEVVSSEGLGIGLGRKVVRFQNAPQYVTLSQEVPLIGGVTYLYTTWVWNQGMQGGSNIVQRLRDGRTLTLYDVQVFTIGAATPYWQVVAARFKAPADLVSAGFSLVARGEGTAYFDNVRLTVFEGSDYAAEAVRVSSPPKIDGNLDDWDGASPIPLIGRNQLTIHHSGYRWTPVNLNAVCFLKWDDENLYAAVEVLDDVHSPSGDGEGVVGGDSVILAFDPTGRAPDASARSFAYYLSSQSPGGSGRHTLYRPAGRTGGRTAGHLARDSSVYDIAVVRNEGRTLYELRIPWSELSILPSAGRKFGFSVQVNDSDGEGLNACMNWGGGLSPAWTPGEFGIVTLTEKRR